METHPHDRDDAEMHHMRLVHAATLWEPTDIGGEVIKKGYIIKYEELRYTVEAVDRENRKIVIGRMGVEPFSISPVASELKIVSK